MDKLKKLSAWQKILCVFALLLIIVPAHGNPFFQLTIIFGFLLSIFLAEKFKAAELENWVELLPPNRSVWTLPGLLWFTACGVVMVAALLVLERGHHYYFTQMDNHSQFLPNILPAMRGFFDEGIFPTWNGYQLLGAPTSSVGYHALTYPITYMCYAAASFLCKDENLTLELFVWLHLLVGYLTCFWLLRYMSVRPSLAASGAFCFVMMGFNILFGLTWYYISPTVTYLPLLGLSLVSCMRTPPGSRWAFGTALTIGCYFHSGNVQMWSYGMLFWGLCMLWILACNPKNRAAYFFPLLSAGLAGLALAMPLLFVQFLQTAGVPRWAWDINIAPVADSLLVPWFQTVRHSIDPAQNFVQQNTVLVFSGGVFTLAFFIRLALDIAFFRRAERISPRLLGLCFSFTGLLALMLAFGTHALLWDILNSVPPFSKFRMPVKILPFMTLFMIMSGAPLIETLLRRKPQLRFRGSFLSAIAVMLLVCNYHDLKSFVVYADLPFPALPADQKQFQASGFTTRGRVLPMSPVAQDQKNYTLTLAHNYPSLYEIPVTSGFDIAAPLEPGLPENRRATDYYKRDPLGYINAFGVEWVTVSAIPYDNDVIPTLRNYYDGQYAEGQAMIRWLRQLGFPESHLGVLDAFDVRSSHTKPLAYIDAPAPSALLYHLRTDGIDVKLPPQKETEPAQTLIANFLYRPWFKAWTEKDEKLAPYADAAGRLAVKIPAGTRMVSFRYAPPWISGFGIGLGFLFGAIAVFRRGSLFVPANKKKRPGVPDL